MLTKSYTNIQDAIQNFGLNFEVEKTPLYTKVGDEYRQYKGELATRRTDTNKNLGIVGDGYEVVQNLEQFEVFQQFADKGEILFENGGYFGGGKRTFIQVVLPSTIDINFDRGDITKKYITIASSHDGSLSLQAFLSPVRIICGNTFRLAIKTGEQKTKIKHTITAGDKLREAINIISGGIRTYEVFEEFLVDSSKTKEFSDKEVKKFVDIILPNKGNDKEISTKLKNQRNSLLNTIHSGIGQPEIKRLSAYKLFQGTTAYTNHVIVGEKNPFEFVSFATGFDINNRSYDTVQKLLKGDLVLA